MTRMLYWPSSLARVPANFAHRQALQLRQVTVQRALIPFRFTGLLASAAHAIGGNLPAGWQGNQSPLRQLPQQRSRRHVLQLSRPVAPVPARGQLPGQTPAAPVGILSQPLADALQVHRTQATALDNQVPSHAPNLTKPKSGVQSKWKKSLHPMPLPPRSALHTVQEQRQFLRAQGLAWAFAHRGRKATPLQPLGAKNQSRPVPKKNL